MRVVFLTHNSPGRPGDLHGAQLGLLARALMRRGNSVRVVAPGEDHGEADVDGVKVVQVRIPRPARHMISSGDFAQALRTPLGWLGLRRLQRELRSKARDEIAAGVDVLHAHGWLPAGLAAQPVFH